ncbi:MAG: DUF2294 domain-containing protein [Solirubrobacterales bacterium]|nr:DUF2294 domain-containing protein [Solirubrobacterales bacterium]MBV9473384.1 DUF2294 domain-containing protein [Solirubrobacterales bacterium]MBV9839016.1 DUF2294 domain-containing protein [Solirubrobacterales bacterium]
MLEENVDAQAISDGVGAEQVVASRSLEISNALARLHKQYVGRGPTSARTTIDGNLVVCLLEGGYTQAEQTLEATDKGDVVAAGRLGLQQAMRRAMIEAVEEALGRRVCSFMSANDIVQNLQVEVFVLYERELTGLA